MWKYLFLLPLITVISFQSNIINDINLPPEHIPYFFNNFPTYASACSNDPECRFKGFIGKKSCWGYEKGCKTADSYHVRPQCPGDHRGWVKTKEAQYDAFFTQADFGYVKEQIEELMVICEASFPDDTSLECSKYLRFCRGRNLMLNFTGLVGRGNNLRYKMDILGPGQLGGYCKFYPERLQKEAEHMSALQSWGPELTQFVDTPQRPMSAGMCDVVIDKPTYIMKLDASVNMYHHFCDFFNLYASLHVNSTHPSTFSKDNHILVWETFTYDSAFKDAFKAFTNQPIWDLKEFRGKVVCFKNVVFPLLPRMIFGLYYNTPLIYGCERSGLFHAFSKHILHSLNIKLQLRQNDKVRVTLLSRGTMYRTILNEKEIVEALLKDSNYEVNRVVYDRTVPFTKQLEITHNTDIFIGMHGAGLTHMLFLPDWACVFEVYNCEDPNCYFDLARLRGLKYVTWEDKEKFVQQDEGRGPDGGGHAKFTNYSFDVKEFLRLVNKCATHVRKRQDFKSYVEASLLARAHEEL
ncbi:EGF domain-specific O-linked N-acetylglucosamine transferase [Plutella xylostella]|uniref:EGF domain-specific O-linked N-acetylglucosamine transferase n=1 Tax=Plutella xylostella TaxID=51655 RepID=UPI002032EA1B|nr:EGF domain-specific O-linked N-acetylglucosamine transferase [Plutella xylostella]XP_037976899.2 EGF domain-specific O-linked N-acetylglucosamine transferase [Plutella xylostella]